MKLMSDYVTKLEGFPDLEVSIIRETKIHKVLKAILKLEEIPKEDEFKFKPRSQALLDKWNKLLAADATPATAAAEMNGTSKGASKTNGAAEKSESAEPAKPNEEGKEAGKEETKAEAKEESKADTEQKSEGEAKPENGSEKAAEEVSRTRFGW